MIKFYKTSGEHGHMSNFYPCSIFFDNHIWASSERLYQASKTHDVQWKDKIRLSATNFDACALGRSKELPIRQDWEEVKIDVMYDILIAKYSQNPNLRRKLISTGTQEIIEDSPTDYFWGCGKDGTGQNILGKLLMNVRESLRA